MKIEKENTGVHSKNSNIVHEWYETSNSQHTLNHIYHEKFCTWKKMKNGKWIDSFVAMIPTISTSIYPCSSRVSSYFKTGSIGRYSLTLEDCQHCESTHNNQVRYWSIMFCKNGPYHIQYPRLPIGKRHSKLAWFT